MSLTLIDTLCAATAAMMALQSLFLGLTLIAHPARRSHANLALAIASIAFALAMTENIVRYWGGEDGRTEYFWAGVKLPILFIPPFAYLHIVGMTSGPAWRFKRADAWHGLLCLIGCLWLVVALALGSQPLAKQLIQVIFIITVAQSAYYLWAGLRRTRNGDSPQIAWLRLLLLGLGAFALLHAFIQSAHAIFGDVPMARLITHCCATSVLYFIGWASLTHGNAFSRPPEQIFQALVAPLDKYRKSRQSEGEAKRILGKLDQAVLADALYREAGLTLPALAAKVGAKPNMVSQALNETLGVSFFDYINGHRIEEAKRLLRESADVGTILDIAYAVGFNSKSTFNAAFKKHTGQTPSLFRKQTAAGTGL